ncbi:MAG: response regulator [Pseudanabaenaceae cyanobacterium]
MTVEPSCSLSEVLALVQERVQVQGPQTPIAEDGQDWGWLVPVLLACGRMGWAVTVIPQEGGVTLRLPRVLTAAEQVALQQAWQGEAVDPTALPVDAWDWYGCRLQAGGRRLAVSGACLRFTAAEHQRWLVVSAEAERAAPILRALQRQGRPCDRCLRAEEALARLRAEPGFSHVAIDRALPVVDGDTLAQAIAADPHLAHLRLVALGGGPLTPPWHQVWEETAAPPSPWVDWEGLRQMCEGDRTLATALLQQFFETMPEGMQQLTEALATADGHRLAQIAHYLKGVAATAQVYRLPALCDALQESTTHGDPYAGLATLQAALSEVMAAEKDILAAIAAWPELPSHPQPAERPLRILLADDDEGTLTVLAHALQDVGIVTAVTSGEAAWEHLKTGAFDVAVCDWSMPDTSGIVLCQRLRWVARSQMPFVLLTARADEAFRQLAFTAGVSRYFAKPVPPAALRATILELSHGG